MGAASVVTPINDIHTRHGFLAELHRMLKPKVYMEIGVQAGISLSLAQPPTLAIGIDPHAQLSVAMAAPHEVYRLTSDEYFDSIKGMDPKIAIDLGFIDGMHHAEYALRDFLNMEQYATPTGVIAFDDVLPRNQYEASRIMRAGDWTGDVWRIHPYLQTARPDLKLRLVNVHPTGLLLVTGLKPQLDLWETMWETANDHELWSHGTHVPLDVLMRTEALDPSYALNQLEQELLSQVEE